MFVHVWVHFMSDCLEGIEQDARKDSQIRFRRFVNPVQITVASLLSPHRTPLWNSSSEAITPRWRILDVITSICRLFYSHCEVTCRLPLTSPHNGQLQSTHQSLSAKNVDTQNLVEITTLDYLETSTNLLMCRIISYSLHCVNAPITSFLYAISKLSSALNATFTSPSLMVWRTYILEGLIYHLIWILCQEYRLSFPCAYSHSAEGKSSFRHMEKLKVTHARDWHVEFLSTVTLYKFFFL